jgi:hypothetical protein
MYIYFFMMSVYMFKIVLLLVLGCIHKTVKSDC